MSDERSGKFQKGLLRRDLLALGGGALSYVGLAGKLRAAPEKAAYLDAMPPKERGSFALKEIEHLRTLELGMEAAMESGEHAALEIAERMLA
jgi:hypothetical protein